LPPAQIRKMTPGDLVQVMEIEHYSFSLPWSRSSFEKELRDNGYACYLVAETAETAETGKVVGYAGCWVLFDEAHITTLAVHPAYRRSGIGSLLLTSLLEMADARGAEQIFLEVRDSNMAARRLYTEFGFEIKGIRKKYYHDEDALVMVRLLHRAGMDLA